MDHFVSVLHEREAPSRPVAVKASACNHDAHELFLRKKQAINLGVRMASALYSARTIGITTACQPESP